MGKPLSPADGKESEGAQGSRPVESRHLGPREEGLVYRTNRIQARQILKKE